MLSAEDREVLLTRCVCGHSINDHGSLVPCWLCEDEGGVCALSFESLLAERVGRIVARSVSAALNEAADRVSALNASGWRAESDHDCDGTEEVCAARCPIQVQVQVSPDEIRAAILTTRVASI